MSSRVLERPAGEKEFEPAPVDGSEASLNPPPFRWLAHDGVVRWMVELTGPDGGALRFGPLRDCILALRRKLAVGRWRWQFIGLDAAGNEVGRGAERAFIIRRGLRGFAVPDVRKLERAWRGLRPRLFGKRIAQVREHLADDFAVPFGHLESWCEQAEAEDAIREPAGYGPHPPDSEEHNNDWIRIYSVGRVASAHAVRFALSFLLTGNEKHLALAKRWAMNCLAWSPWGSTSLATCDEAGMPLLERLAMVYDWLHPHWTDFERGRFMEVMLIRGEEARERDRQVNFAARPFFNYQCRTLAFTGKAAIAFLGEIPQAAEWLDYVLSVMAVSYPSGSWGSDDGGWSQGPGYWSAYMAFLSDFVAAACELGIDFAAAPYYRNTGYFAAYTLPPYAPSGGFGDGAGGAGFNHKLVVGAFAEAARDGHLRSYADQVVAHLPDPAKLAKESAVTNQAYRWDGWGMCDVMSLLVSPGRSLEARDLRELPPARVFPYIGVAAAHSALGDRERDTWLLFKSGPFGSSSHSHADQNSFQLYAYGEALLIDSGYYPWYGSPHDVLWTRQSWAHNMVLVGGHGQPPFDWFARGRIESFAASGRFAYTRGEAADAYNRPANGMAMELGAKHCPELVSKMGPATQVERASRSVLAVLGERPWYAVLDWLETADAVQFQWLAHAHDGMELASDGFAVRRGGARLLARIVYPSGLSIAQTEQFPVAPEARAKGLPSQWHLTAETSEASRAARFLAVLVPHVEGVEPPAVERIEAEGVIGARVGEDVMLAPCSGAGGAIRAGGIEACAAVVAVSGNRIVVAEATRLEVMGKVLVESASPVTGDFRVVRSKLGV